MKPRVSVLIPVFNGEPYLAAAIESVQAQTFEDYEFIIVDDGSTDGSADMIAGFAASDPRIRAYRKSNSGISETLNLGIAEARGDWIARFRIDDPARDRHTGEDNEQRKQHDPSSTRIFRY